MTDNATNHHMQMVRVICYSYVSPVICWIGIITNILNVLVLSRRHMKSSPYTFLAALAVADMGTLVISFTYFQMHMQMQKTDASSEALAYYVTLFGIYIVNPGLNMFTSASVWLIVLLTVDRYLSVQFPLLAKTFCSRANARRKVLFSFLVATALNSLRWFQYDIATVIVNGTRVASARPTDLRNSGQFTYFLWAYAAIVMYIPSVILVITNTYLLLKVQSMRRLRRMMLPGFLISTQTYRLKREEVRLTVTLVVITFLFVICIIPSSFSEIPVAYALFGRGMTMMEFKFHPPYVFLVTVANMLVLLNCSLNFFMYCAFNQNFVRTMKQMFSDIVRKVTGNIERQNSQTRCILNATP